MGGNAKDVVQQPVIDDHADERLGGEQRVHFPEHAVSRTARDVSSQEFIKHPVPVPEKHVRQFMPFQRAEEQQPQ